MIILFKMNMSKFMSSLILAVLIVTIQLLTCVESNGRGIFLFRHGKIDAIKTKTQMLNESIVKHGYENTSDVTVFDYNYKYYQQTVLRANKKNQIIDWIDLNKPHDYESNPVTDDQVLSRNYLHSRIVWLKFKFPFYGHMIDRILVTNVGFIYAGTLLSPYISKAQYIAPLMANFDVTLSPNSSVKYVDNSTHFVCTWEKLRLSHQPECNFFVVYFLK